MTQAAVNDPAVLKVMPPLTVDEPAIERFVGALDVVLADTNYASAFVRFSTELLRNTRS